MRKIAGLVMLVSAALVGCTGLKVDTHPTASEEDLYRSLYPYYAEYCAASQLKKKKGLGVDISSGIGGHSVFYLNGACRDRSAGYPTLKLCDETSPPDEDGVGLSVNAHYKNANWVATSGRDFFYHGTLKPGQRLTREVYEDTLATAERMGILDGVVFHREVFDDQPKGMSRERFMYEISVATDFALNFGRDRYCARVPLDREKMTRVIDYLNGLNAPYRDGTKSFDWDVLTNNCSHVTHNALAAAGIWDVWEMGRFLLIAAFDFPTPKNEFVNLMRRTNDGPLADPDAVFADDAARQALMAGEGLPTQPGSLAQAEAAAHANDFYDTDLALIFYDEPLTGSYEQYFRQIFSEPRYTNLRANLAYFRDLYARIAHARRPLSGEAHDKAGAERDAFAAFYARYYAYIDRASATVNAALASLNASAAARQP
ncbi:MAG TPA: hypothetical protein VLX85_01450 [Stellaceae bacterium]|nr:hypothetical protein [Stellaceae bacterium]